MGVKRWQEESIEQLSSTVGRRVLHTETMTVALINLAKGAVVPRHSHPNEQVVNVLEGRLRVVLDDGELEAAAGETVPLAADVPHEVEALEDTVVLDVFSPVREDWLRGEDAYLRDT